MKIEMRGFDKVQRQLEEAKAALAGLDGTIATLPVRPGDPASVDAAIRAMVQAIDRKVARFKGNPIVARLVEQAKKLYRTKIQEMACQ